MSPVKKEGCNGITELNFGDAVAASNISAPSSNFQSDDISIEFNTLFGNDGVDIKNEPIMEYNFGLPSQQSTTIGSNRTVNQSSNDYNMMERDGGFVTTPQIGYKKMFQQQIRPSQAMEMAMASEIEIPTPWADVSVMASKPLIPSMPTTSSCVALPIGVTSYVDLPFNMNVAGSDYIPAESIDRSPAGGKLSSQSIGHKYINNQTMNGFPESVYNANMMMDRQQQQQQSIITGDGELRNGNDNSSRIESYDTESMLDDFLSAITPATTTPNKRLFDDDQECGPTMIDRNGNNVMEVDTELVYTGGPNRTLRVSFCFVCFLCGYFVLLSFFVEL